jgi:hypothetical protein
MQGDLSECHAQTANAVFVPKSPLLTFVLTAHVPYGTQPNDGGRV